MKKIMHINHTFNKGGGATRIAKNLHFKINEFDTNFKSFFCFGRGKKRAGSSLEFKLSYDFETYLQFLITRIFGYQGYGSYFSTKKFNKFIKQNKIDLIHLHALSGYYINISFVENLNLPIVWTFHDAWAFTGRCAFTLNCNKWKKICGPCPIKTNYPKTLFDVSNKMWQIKKNIFGKKNKLNIVVPSKWMKKKVSDSFFDKNNLDVIPNGIDINIFKPKQQKNIIKKKYNIATKKKIILFVASDLNDEIKGAKYFFNALEKINDDDILAVTIGNKYKQLKNKRNIRQLGYISNEKELANIYNMSDVYCITSLDENFPTTVLESLACGVPVVGFNTGGIPEQLDGNCGVIVPQKDSNRLKNSLLDILYNDDLRNDYGKNARQKAVSEYSLEIFSERYTKLYKQLI